MLLGKVPPYEALPHSDEIPELAMDDSHPYHVVVFAAQECPAPSGMPRGLGGSLMKGVGLQKSEAHRREKDEKKEEERDARKTLKEIRKEYKEREGPAVTLKDLKAKEKGIGLGLVTESATDKPVSPDYAEDSSTDTDSSVPKERRSASFRRETVTEPSYNNKTASIDIPVTEDTANGSATTVPIALATPGINGDSARVASDPLPAKPLTEPNGDQQAPPPPPHLPATPQLMEKLSREQLRIDSFFKRKTDLLKDASSTPLSPRGHTPFDIGVGSPMTDLAGTMGRGGPRGWSAMLEGAS